MKIWCDGLRDPSEKLGVMIRSHCNQHVCDHAQNALLLARVRVHMGQRFGSERSQSRVRLIRSLVSKFGGFEYV